MMNLFCNALPISTILSLTHLDNDTENKTKTKDTYKNVLLMYFSIHYHNISRQESAYTKSYLTFGKSVLTEDVSCPG